ncbi:A disintegrin and metalloproteinase with thrombospondin motifs 20, partial [Xenoophorus captivus]
QAGCDHVLNSKARNDKCGVCGGDNSSCKTLAGTFNDAQYGYNAVVRIPAGATNIDIKQVSYSGKPEDDNYLGEWALCISIKRDLFYYQTRRNSKYNFQVRILKV